MFRGLRKPCRLIFLREACAFAVTGNTRQVNCRESLWKTPLPHPGRVLEDFAQRSCVFLPRRTALRWMSAFAAQPSRSSGLSLDANFFVRCATLKNSQERIHDLFSRFAQSFSGRPSRPPRGDSLEALRPSAPPARHCSRGLPSASAVWRDHAQQSGLPNREIARCSRHSRAAIQFSRRGPKRWGT